jgi:hypothetical protein
LADLSFRSSSSTSSTGVPIVADTRQLSRLARDLRASVPTVWKAYRLAAREAAQPVLETARANFAAPGPKEGSQGAPQSAASLRIRTTAGGNVKIVAGGPNAPAAAALENRGKGFVRHPGPGNDRENWTTKNSRPAAMAPALEAHRAEVEAALEAAVVEAVESALRGGV